MVGYILNPMVQYVQSRFDASFAALADPTRRGVLAELGQADASITELANRFDMTLTGMKKHIRVLEDVGLVATEKIGRVRTCRIEAANLAAAEAWLADQLAEWQARTDRLAHYVETELSGSNDNEE